MAIDSAIVGVERVSEAVVGGTHDVSGEDAYASVFIEKKSELLRKRVIDAVEEAIGPIPASKR